MKRLIFILMLVILAGSTIFAQAENELIKQVKAKLEQVKDYTADGTMKIDVSFINAPQSKVKIYFRQPDKFKVIKEGGISVLPKGGVNVNVSTLFAGNQFTIVPAGETVLNGEKLSVLKLLPLQEGSDIVLTTLYIDKLKYLVMKSAVTTKDNGSYEMELYYGKYQRWGLPDKVVFTFNTKDYKLPKGITIEYEKSAAKNKTPAAKNNVGKVEISYQSYNINKGIADSIFK